MRISDWSSAVCSSDLWLAFLHGTGSWRIALDLTLIGMFAGFYVVPLFAFVQARAPREKLSRTLAGTHILNELLIVVAAGFGLGLGALGMDASQILLELGTPQCGEKGCKYVSTP